MIGPIGLSIGALLLALALKGWLFMVNLAVSATLIFFGMGRAVLLLGRDAAERAADLTGWERYFAALSTTELMILILWMDAFAAFMIVFHGSFIYRIPKVGPAMLALQEDGEFILSQHPWFRRFAWLGLVTFVTIPFAATGSVGGSIFGRLLGLSRWATLAGVVAGSLISTLAMYAFANAIKSSHLFDTDNPVTIGAAIAFVLALVAFLNWRYRKVKKRWEAEGRHQSQPAPKHSR